MVREYRRAAGSCGGGRKIGGKLRVRRRYCRQAPTHSSPRPTNSRPMMNAWARPSGLGWYGIAEADSPLGAIPQQLLKRRILGRRDDQNVPDSRQHQRRQRVIDHGFIVNRQQLLKPPQSPGRAGFLIPGEDDAFAHGVFLENQKNLLQDVGKPNLPGGRTRPKVSLSLAVAIPGIGGPFLQRSDSRRSRSEESVQESSGVAFRGQRCALTTVRA